MSGRRQIIAERTPGVRRAGVLLLAIALAGWQGCTSTKPPPDPLGKRPADTGTLGADPMAAGTPPQPIPDHDGRGLTEAIKAEVDSLDRAHALETEQNNRFFLNSTSLSLQSQNLDRIALSLPPDNGGSSLSSNRVPGEAGAATAGQTQDGPGGQTRGAATAGGGAGESSKRDAVEGVPDAGATPPPSAPSATSTSAPPAPANAPATTPKEPPAGRPAAPKDPGAAKEAEVAPGSTKRAEKDAEKDAEKEAEKDAQNDRLKKVAQPGGPGVGRPAATGTPEARRDRLEVPLKVGAEDKAVRDLAAESGIDRGELERPLPRFDEELWVISRPSPRTALRDARRPPDAGAGTLWLGRGLGGRTATLREYKAEATITGPISSVTVSQRFQNELSETVDGVYVLPMPRDAAVTDFVMTVGAPGRERRIRGVIRERAEAERIFLDAQRQGKIASMLDEDTANILVQRIGNIESGAWIATSVTYFATLDYAGIPSGSGTEIAGAYEFTLPMTGLAQVAGSVPVSVSVRLEAGLEILGVLSPTHAISVDQWPESGRTITMGAPVSASTRDFVLRYAVAAPTPRVGVITQRGSSGTYFSMLITPPVSTGERAPLEVAVVADITAETTPAQIQAYRAAAAALLGKLTPTDRFLVASPGGASGVFEPATADAIAAAIARIGPAAGTDRALDASIRDALLPVATTSRLVCVLGRGEISGGVQALREARANLQSARIFAVSIDEPAGFAFESLSRIGRGGVIHLSSDPAASAGNDAIMSRLLDREGSPVMTDLEIDWGGAEVVDVFPRRLPNLSAGRPVHIVGKLLSPPTAGREIRVTGTVRGASGVRRETLTATWNTATPAPGAIPTLWARAKVLMLSEQLAAGSADADGVRREIVELALRHNLVSAMTSFISVDALSSVPPAVRPVPRVEQATNALPR